MKLSDRVDVVVDRLRARGVEVQPIRFPAWLPEFESRMGGPLPETYRQLVSRYAFPTIELGPVELFANLGDNSYDDVTSAPFKDRIMAKWLIRAGYFHFGRKSCGSYDPVCIALKAVSSPKEGCEVVAVDHEAILCEADVVRREVLFDSFLSLLEEYA